MARRRGPVPTSRLTRRPSATPTPTCRAPEVYGDLVGPLDGSIDPLSGHGTFIAGLVHQTCPDADIYAWRVVKLEWPDRRVRLGQRAHQGRRARPALLRASEGGLPVDVLNLSMGYYHETREDRLVEPHAAPPDQVLGKCGTTVVCSAGNDSTALPQYPGCILAVVRGPPRRRAGPVGIDANRVPVVSVGALNPNQTTWRCSATPARRSGRTRPAVMCSTMPPLQGGLEPMARTTAFGFERESLDLDNFSRGDADARRGGFAVWSGTSFAAPVVAARIARQCSARSLRRETTATSATRSPVGGMPWKR